MMGADLQEDTSNTPDPRHSGTQNPVLLGFLMWSMKTVAGGTKWYVFIPLT